MVVVLVVAVEQWLVWKSDVHRVRRRELRLSLRALRAELAGLDAQKEYARFVRAERAVSRASEELAGLAPREPLWLANARLAAPAALAAAGAAAGRSCEGPEWAPAWAGYALFVVCAFRVARMAAAVAAGKKTVPRLPSSSSSAATGA